MIYQSDRTFQLWDYTVGHAQLLLRSPATADEPFNLDIVFLGVQGLDIPTRLPGLVMLKPEPIERPGRKIRHRHRLLTGGDEYEIVAVAFRIYKNQLDLTESSLEYFHSIPPGSPGEVLCHSGQFLGVSAAFGKSIV